MNREILFRGLGLKSRKWIYGNLIHMDDADEDYKDVIIPIEDNCTYVDNDDGYGAEDWHKVESETVGQYTGLKDNNGKEIYEGDITRVYGGEYCQGYYEYDSNCVVKWQSCGFDMVTIKEGYGIGWGFCDNSEYIEVIGNIYENKDLLKQKEND